MLLVSTREVDGTDELASFEERAFGQWDSVSLGDMRAGIQMQHRQLHR